MAGVKVAKKALDMARKARMERAKDMGFDFKGFHGTGADVLEPKGMMWSSETPSLANQYADMRGQMGGAPNVMPVLSRSVAPLDADKMPKTLKVGEFFSEMLKQAEARGVNVGEAEKRELAEAMRSVREGARAEESGPHYSRHDFWYDPSTLFGKEGAEALDFARSKLGFDSVTMTEGGEKTVGVFDPKNIRSVNAAFDPAKADSPNLLAGVSGLAPLAGLASLAPTEQAQAATIPPSAMMATPYTAMERLGVGYPQEAIPARFPAMHKIANTIDGYKDSTGMMFDTSGTAEYLRRFGEGGTFWQRLGRAFGALPF